MYIGLLPWRDSPGRNIENPAWTIISAGPPACGSCHGNPPPPPHDTGTDCSTCHPQTVSATGEIIVSGGHHINGVIESTSGYHPDGWDAATVHGYAFFDTPSDCKSCHGTNLDGGTSGQSCDTCHTGGTAWRTNCIYCHGGRDNTTGAPPFGLHGETTVSSHSVGAHTTHMTVSPSHTAFDCTICHIEPASVTSSGHLDGVPGATLTFSPLAGSSAVYNATNATCSSLYCHGNGRTVSGSVSWTSSTALNCGSCHGYYGSSSSLSGHHATHIGEGYTCSTCHKTIVNSSNTIIYKIAHINGVKNVSLTTGTYNSTTRTCSSLSCHGSETW
jgi:predicted CxxxxCH...CXXCH cytochrome family protein